MLGKGTEETGNVNLINSELLSDETNVKTKHVVKMPDLFVSQNISNQDRILYDSK